MKITDVHIDGFGIWTGLSVDDLPHDAVVFYGRNEAGKTTLMQFVRAMLYGFSPARRDRYLPPVHGGRPGGMLELEHAGESYGFRRHATADEYDAVGQLAVIAPDGLVEGAERLDELLAGVDESIYSNVFAVGLREMQELGTLNDTEAAELLYRLTSGVDRVSIVEVMHELSEARTSLICPEGRPAEIARLLEQRAALEQQVERHVLQARRWPALYGQQQLLDSESRELQQGITRLERQARLVELAAQVRGRWQRRTKLLAELEELQSLPQLPDRAIPRLERLKQKASQRRQRLDEIKQQRLELRREAARLPLNRPLWNQRSRIEAVGEHAQWITSLENQIARLEEEIALLEVERESHWGEMGLDEHVPHAGSLPEISHGVIASLREPARALKQQNQKLEQAQHELKSSRDEAAQNELELESALSARGASNLAEALDDVGEQVSQLRRRMQLEQRIEQLHRHRDELDDQSHDLLDGQVLSVPVWIGIGSLFVVSFVLILMGLFGGVVFSLASGLGWVMLIVGVAGAGVAVAAKIVMERSAQQRLSHCNQQLNVLAEQIQDSRREREELDAEMPSGGGPLDVRLKRAEEELQQLEALLPLDAGRKSAEQRAEAAQYRILQAEEALAEAKRAWREALKNAGLPPKLSPRHIKQAARKSESISDVRGRLSSRQQELNERRDELAAIAARIEQLAEDVGLESVDDLTPTAKAKAGPLPLLRQLTAELTAQRGWFEKRYSLARQERALKRERNRVVGGLKKLLDLRRTLLAQAGVADEPGLRELAGKHEHAARLRDERDKLCEQISLLLSPHAGEDEIAAVLAENTQEELEARWAALSERIEQEREHLAALHERRGALRQELKTLAEDRSLSLAQLELGAVTRRLEQALRRWRTLATMSLLLERIREVYEQERQPETLRDASRYLEQLTDGRYVRVWTPLEQDVLRVDDRHGQPLSIELLSRGTREAVFLALRLALVTQYARRGTVLPVVLDDVLVNFDGDRTKAAARVLRDFAREGRQLLLFTCHEHIMKAFKKLKVEIRELPNRDALLAAPAVEEKPELEIEVEAPPVEPEPLLEPVLVDDLESQWTSDAEPEPDDLFQHQPKPIAQPAAVTVPPEDDEDYTFADEDELSLVRPEPVPIVDLFLYDDEEDTVFDEFDDEYQLLPEAEKLRTTAPPIDESDDEYRLADPDLTSAAEPPRRIAYQQRSKPRPESKRPTEPKRPEPPHRFTWESPEMWWHEQRGDAA